MAKQFKFKVGDKVKIKVWDDMPTNLFDGWGSLSDSLLGENAIIVGIESNRVAPYNISIKKGTDSTTAFEEELEPVLRPHQQLMLFEL